MLIMYISKLKMLKSFIEILEFLKMTFNQFLANIFFAKSKDDVEKIL